MYASLLRLYLEVSQDPLLFVGMIGLLMVSWGLIVTTVFEIAVRIFDVPDAV